jgi:hypothetical protein
MPRLSVWVEGLTHADALVESSSSANTTATTTTTTTLQHQQLGVHALVEMSATARCHCRNVLQQCVEMKKEVARILSSAKRLGMMEEVTETVVEDVTTRRRPMVADLIHGERQNHHQSSLACSSNVKKRALPQDTHKRSSSNRIQIKFHKR